MKKTKLLLTAGLACLALTGCGMNAEKLVEEMTNASSEKQMTTSTVTMNMDLTMTVDETSTDMTMDMVMDMKANADPYGGYSKIDINVNAAGEETTECVELYSVEEDGALANYSYTESTDKWQKEELTLTAEEAASQTINSDWLSEKVKAEEVTLEEETQTVNEKEAYVLSTTLDSTSIQDSLGTMMDLNGIFNQEDGTELDYSNVTAPVTYYIDKETYLPLKIEMDVEGISMDGMEFKTMHVVYDQIGYDNVEIPEVPEEALIIGNQENYNPDKGDGTYVIQEAADAIKITLPDGWTVTEMAYDTLTMEKDDKKQSVVFTMYSGIETGLAFRNYVERGDVIDFLKDGTYGSHGSSDLANDYGGIWLKTTTGTNYYYAWDSVGERCFVFVKMSDKTGKYDRNKLDSILTNIEEYDLLNE